MNPDLEWLRERAEALLQADAVGNHDVQGERLRPMFRMDVQPALLLALVNEVEAARVLADNVDKHAPAAYDSGEHTEARALTDQALRSARGEP